MGLVRFSIRWWPRIRATPLFCSFNWQWIFFELKNQRTIFAVLSFSFIFYWLFFRLYNFQIWTYCLPTFTFCIQFILGEAPWEPFWTFPFYWRFSRIMKRWSSLREKTGSAAWVAIFPKSKKVLLLSFIEVIVLVFVSHIIHEIFCLYLKTRDDADSVELSDQRERILQAL